MGLGDCKQKQGLFLSTGGECRCWWQTGDTVKSSFKQTRQGLVRLGSLHGRLYACVSKDSVRFGGF